VKAAALFAFALAALPVSAEAAFDTWRFPGAPLPFKLDGVDFERADRRDAVVEAIRAMAASQLKESGLFRADATETVRVDLRDVETTATVARDGTGLGRAAILYRVTDAGGTVLFNDRIVAETQVTVPDSVELRQSTARAARYRAFTRNLELFTLRFARTVAPAPDAPLRLAGVSLAHPLETPERTADFAALVKDTLDAQIPTAADAPAFALAVEGLSLAAAAPPLPEQSAAEVRLDLALAAPTGAVVWRGHASARAATSRDRALRSGLSPTDTAIAEATQGVLRSLAPEIAAAAFETGAFLALAEGRRLPYALVRLDAAPGFADHGLLPRLRRWNLEGQPLAAIWTADGPPLAVRVADAAVKLIKTGKGEGVAEVRVAWEALRADGSVALARDETTRTPFSAADARLHGLDAGDWAVRVGLRDNWIGLIDALAALPAP